MEETGGKRRGEQSGGEGREEERREMEEREWNCPPPSEILNTPLVTITNISGRAMSVKRETLNRGVWGEIGLRAKALENRIRGRRPLQSAEVRLKYSLSASESADLVD